MSGKVPAVLAPEVGAPEDGALEDGAPEETIAEDEAPVAAGAEELAAEVLEVDEDDAAVLLLEPQAASASAAVATPAISVKTTSAKHVFSFSCPAEPLVGPRFISGVNADEPNTGRTVPASGTGPRPCARLRDRIVLQKG